MNAIVFTPERPAEPALRRLLRSLGRRAVGGLGRGLSGLLGSRAGSAFGILTYHRVGPLPAGPAPTWNVTPGRLREQLAGLLRRGYRPLPLHRLLDASTAAGPRAFAVTFDDGYEGVHRHAWPVLRELGVPATVFLATAYLDSPGPFPFDDWVSAGAEGVEPSSWRPLTAAQCDEMRAGGLIDLGSHTHTHQVFRDRPDDLHRDVAASLEVLKARFGVERATFAFPFGIAEAALVEAVRQAGAVCALSTRPELVRPGSDPFAWGRFGVGEADSAASIAARLDGWYDLARGAWRRLGGRRTRG
jgi:peptidoglycan/xylan/chitin deacetylase (PgdA/CDA1 family)